MIRSDWHLHLLLFWLLMGALTAAGSGCGQDYKDSPRSAIDQANDFLTVGNCDSALDILTPVINSSRVTNEARLIYASAYGCKGGIFLTNLITALANASSDIWTALVQSNPSAGHADGKLASLMRAADVLRSTASPVNSFNASARGEDANVFMIFVQINTIAVVISPLGNANLSTGHKTQSISGATAQDKCLIEVAVATISDSLQYASAGSQVSKIYSQINNICSGALGVCPTNKDVSVCTATEQNQGAALLLAIDSQWQ